MARNLVDYFCEGLGRRFGGIPCEHYHPSTGECTLLKQFVLKEIFEKGRCQPFEILKRAVQKHLEKYRDLVNPGEHVDAMAFELSERIKRQRLRQGFKIYVLKGYINKTIYAEVTGMLHHETAIVRRQCGYCKHLSQSKPYTCLQETIVTTKDGEIENPHYGNTRKFIEKACKDGFEPLEDTSIETSEQIAQSPVVFPPDYTPGMLFADMTKMLTDRIERAQDHKTRKRYDRQYVGFCKLLDLLRKGIPKKEANKMIAETLGVSAKTIDREFQEIREFFCREGVF